jgi:hypothetical protein
MSPTRSFTTVGLLVALGVLPTISAGPVAAQVDTQQTNPIEITSDTPEYCMHLLDRVTTLLNLASAPVPQNVTDLTIEGHRMCDHGQTRGGIMRLRSALMIMEKTEGSAYR